MAPATVEIRYGGRAFMLTTEHACSSYGVPVLLDAQGRAYGPWDIATSSESAMFYRVESYARAIVHLAVTLNPGDSALTTLAEPYLAVPRSART